MKIKRILALLLTVLIAAVFPVFSYAADPAVVYADAVATNPNSIFFIPVSIKNNPGIMGFKITVTYDPAVISLPAVSRGTVTQTGMLNDSVGVSDEGTIEIVWTNDAAVANDGTLFILSFNADEVVETENTQLTLSYSQPDTFNEAYEDVVFDCKTISVSFGDDENVSSAYPGEIKEPDYKDVIIAVDSAIKEMPFDSIANIDRDLDAEFLESVNKTLGIMTGTENYFASVDEIIGAYKAATVTDFVNTSVEAVDPNDIDSIINSAVQAAGAETVDAIPAEKKAEFIASVENALNGLASDIDLISDTLTEDEAIEAIKALQSTNEVNKNSGIPVVPPPQETGRKLTGIIVAAAAAIVVVFAVIAVLIKRKQKKYKEEKVNEEND